MQLGDISVEFVESRYNALGDRWSGRNADMDEYEKLYELNYWETSPEPDERRITPPTCFDAVEEARTLLVTRAPVISVPPSEVKEVQTDRAEAIEKYLYGVWSEARVAQVMRDGEFFATCFGEGVVRVVYDPLVVEGELPLLVQALDPRKVYASPSGKPLEDVEVIHAWDRPRREIEAEWGEVPSGPGENERREEWLDESVPFIDYWRVDVVVGEREEDARLSTDALDEGRSASVDATNDGAGPVERFVNMLRGKKGGGGTAEAVTTNREAKVRRRVVTNCVVADGEWVKKPKRMVGYPHLPFVRYAGIRTPLENEKGARSILFPITGGTRKNGAVGVAAAEAEAVAYRQRLVEMFASPALLTDDPNLAEKLDMTPGAINLMRRDAKVDWLVAPGPHPAADAQIDLMKSYIEDATLPETMRGRYVGDISGIALTALSNVVMMKVAARQEEREEAYQRVNGLVLALTEEYAPPEGWEVWGVDRTGNAFEAPLRPEEIGGYRRNIVKLSASLPKDEAGEIMSMASLVQQDLLSRETFLDELQQVKRLASQSPQDEVKRILRDKLLFDGEMAAALGKLVLKDYSPELAQVLAAAVSPGGGLAEGGVPPSAGGPPMPAGPGMGAGRPMPPGGPPMPGGPGAGPMMGMPPGVVPPMPGAVGAGGPGGMSPESVAAMMRMQHPAMQGQPVPPGGGR